MHGQGIKPDLIGSPLALQRGNTAAYAGARPLVDDHRIAKTVKGGRIAAKQNVIPRPRPDRHALRAGAEVDVNIAHESHVCWVGGYRRLIVGKHPDVWIDGENGAGLAVIALTIDFWNVQQEPTVRSD